MNTKTTNRPPETAKKMTFMKVLDSEFYYLVEAIEHGSSDPENIETAKRTLKEKTGYEYQN